jgi:hypothetical protein
MCECGCGDGNPLFKFPGPKGVIYAFHVNPGCTNCEAPAGIIIVRYKDKGSAEDFNANSLKAMPFRDDNFELNNDKADRSEFVMAIADPEKIIGKLLEICGEYSIHMGKAKPPLTVKELLTDIEPEEGHRFVLEGVTDTIDEFVKILDKDPLK